MDSERTSAEHSLALRVWRLNEELNRRVASSRPRRHQGRLVKEVRNAEIERRYLAGETMQEIGDSLEITRGRVCQILERRDVLVGERQARGAKKNSERTQLRRARKIAAHRQAIIELKRQGFTNSKIAQRFQLNPKIVSQVLREAFSEEEYRMLQCQTGPYRISDAQLLEQVREAYRVLGPTMRERDYGTYAKSHGWIGGYQTLHRRFGSWNRTCDLASVSVQTRRYRRKRQDFVNRKTCLDAVRHVHNALGHIPTVFEYDRYTRTALGKLPCVSVVARRCGGWKNVIRVLLMDAGPQEASGK